VYNLPRGEFLLEYCNARWAQKFRLMAIPGREKNGGKIARLLQYNIKHIPIVLNGKFDTKKITIIANRPEFFF